MDSWKSLSQAWTSLCVFCIQSLRIDFQAVKFDLLMDFGEDYFAMLTDDSVGFAFAARGREGEGQKI